MVVLVRWSGATLLLYDLDNNSSLDQKILKVNVWPSFLALKLKAIRVMLQDNYAKHTYKSTSDSLKKFFQVLWHNLKQAKLKRGTCPVMSLSASYHK